MRNIHTNTRTSIVPISFTAKYKSDLAASHKFNKNLGDSKNASFLVQSFTDNYGGAF